jgi:AcrR family transcriptional regulator
VAAARQLLEAEGLEAVTLRAVAAATGVSRQAPYHHFADKSALLAAVAANGFEALANAMTALMDKETTPAGRMEASGVGYVVFALENPALFRLMFGGSGENFETDADLVRCRGRAHQVMTDALKELGPRSPEELETGGVAAWAIVHGLAELINKGALRAPLPLARAAKPFIGAVLRRLRL